MQRASRSASIVAFRSTVRETPSTSTPSAPNPGSMVISVESLISKGIRSTCPGKMRSGSGDLVRVGRDDPRELGAVAVYVGGDVEQRVAADDGAQLIALEGREARRGAVGHDARTEVDRARGVEDLAPVLAAELEPLHEEARPPKLAPETSTFRENSCAVTAPNLKLADHLVVAVG